MQIRYQDYVIEQYEYWYVLRQVGITKEWDNAGKEYDKRVLYPPSLQRCLHHIRQWLQRESEIKSLDELHDKLQELDAKFLKDLNNLLP